MPAADVDRDVVDRARVRGVGREEDQVARAGLRDRHVRGLGVLGHRVVRQVDARALPGPHGQARAVEARRAGGGPLVPLAELGTGVGHRDPPTGRRAVRRTAATAAAPAATAVRRPRARRPAGPPGPPPRPWPWRCRPGAAWPGRPRSAASGRAGRPAWSAARRPPSAGRRRRWPAPARSALAAALPRRLRPAGGPARRRPSAGAARR